LTIPQSQLASLVIQGAQGRQGFVGAQGVQGATGAQGVLGAQGVQGTIGAQGAQGVVGAQGVLGAQGVQGATGAQGAQGAVGAQGVQGATGAQGVLGAQGVQGATGSPGAQGVQGATGSPGAQGVQGATGAQGVQGATGPVAGSANQVVYKDGSNNAAGSANFTFDGTNLLLNAANPNFQGTSSTGSATLVNSSGGAFVKVYGGSHATRANYTDFINGSSTSTFTSGGYLGIGTSNPAALLSVSGALGVSTYAEVARFSNTSLNSGAKLTFYGVQGSQAFTTLYGSIGFNATYNQDANGQAAFIIETGNNGSVSEKFRITHDGNVGLGVSSLSSWSSQFKALQIGSNAAKYASFGQRINSTGNLFLSWNAFNDSTGTSSSNGWKYTATGDASGLYLMAGAHAWYIAPAGTAGDAITFTQAMTLDASGNLGIGTTNPQFRLDVMGSVTFNGSAGRNVLIASTDSAGAGYGGGISFGGNYNGTNSLVNDFAGIQGVKENGIQGNYSGALRFTTRTDGSAPVEAMRIDSSGSLLIGGTGQTAVGEKFLVQNNATSSSSVSMGIYSGTSGVKDLNFYSNGNSQFFTAARIRVAGGVTYTDEGYMAFWTTSNNGSNVLTTSEKMRISAEGSVSITQAPGKYTIDVTGGATSIANGGVVDFPSASGMLIVNNWTDGQVTIYLCGGGSTGVVANVAGTQVGSFAYVAGIAGYRWTNNYGSTATFGFFFVRTRNTA
jgi:hypothetical protein